MSRPCPGGCGHRLYDCCDQAVGEPHQTRCRTRSTRAVRVDGLPVVHKAYQEFPLGGTRELVCVGGCDLSTTVCYELVDDGVVARAAGVELCPAWPEAGVSTRVPTWVPTSPSEDDPTVDHLPVIQE